MRDDRDGSILLLSLFTLTGLAMMINMGLTRAMTEQLASTRYVATQRAFHLAEAGGDDALWEFTHSDADFTDAEGWTNATPCPVGNTCRKKPLSLVGADVTVNDTTGATPTIIATGSSAGIPPQTLEVEIGRAHV